MERSRAVLITFMYVLISRISGAEVEVMVRRGDNVTLYSDCVWKTGFNTVWFRNSSHENQPPLIMPVEDLVQVPRSLPRYSAVWNNKTYDLLVENVSESDLGLYFCALREKKITEDKTGGGVQINVYHYGNRTTRLSLLDSTVPRTDPPRTPSTPPVSDCSVCWKLLVGVCPVCVLLSSVVSSTCVYCIYRHRDKGEKRPGDGVSERNRNQKQVGGEGVCYASLDLPNRRQRHLKKKKKKKRVESSEFSIYSEVKTGHMRRIVDVQEGEELQT